MLAHDILLKNSIDTYKQEIFPVFMLEDDVFIICTLNWVKMEEIANFDCNFSTKKASR